MCLSICKLLQHAKQTLDAFPSLSVLMSVRRVRRCVMNLWHIVLRATAILRLLGQKIVPKPSEQGGTHDSIT